MTALVFVVVEQAIVTVVWCFWLCSLGSMAVMIAELLCGLPQKLALEVNVPVAMPFEPDSVSCVQVPVPVVTVPAAVGLTVKHTLRGLEWLTFVNRVGEGDRARLTGGDRIRAAHDKLVLVRPR